MNITYKYREDEIIIENKYRYNKKMLDKTGKKTYITWYKWRQKNLKLPQPILSIKFIKNYFQNRWIIYFFWRYEKYYD